MTSKKSEKKAHRKAVIVGTKRYNRKTAGGTRKNPDRLSVKGEVEAAKRGHKIITKEIKEHKIQRLKKGEVIRPNTRIVPIGNGLGRTENKPAHKKKDRSAAERTAAKKSTNVRKKAIRSGGRNPGMPKVKGPVNTKPSSYSKSKKR